MDRNLERQLERQVEIDKIRYNESPYRVALRHALVIFLNILVLLVIVVVIVIFLSSAIYGCDRVFRL